MVFIIDKLEAEDARLLEEADPGPKDIYEVQNHLWQAAQVVHNLLFNSQQYSQQINNVIQNILEETDEESDN